MLECDHCRAIDGMQSMLSHQNGTESTTDQSM